MLDVAQQWVRGFWGEQGQTWANGAFVTNHGAVLALVALHGQITTREMALRLSITERSVHRVIGDLEGAGYVEKNRQGRVNRYRVRHDLPLRRDMRHGAAVGDLLRVLSDDQVSGD